MIQALKSLGMQFRDSKDLEAAELKKAHSDLTSRLAQLIKNVEATPADWCYSKADREIEEGRKARCRAPLK